VERQVTEPLEDYIFSYKEVRKAKTISTSRDGMAVIQVQLNDNIKNKDEFWSKFKHGANDFKAQLPQSVVALSVMDDFGDTSALLITMESEDKTYRELDNYMDDLKDRLRRIETVGRMTVYGMHNEQISVTLDNDRLSHYGLSDQALAMTLFSKGFATTAGRVKSDTYVSPIYVGRTMNSLHDVQEMIVFSTPDGEAVRLKDVADVRREYPVEESVITNNGRKCLLLSVEMKKGKNIVQMGEAVKEVLDAYAETLPQDVTLFKITDQSDVVAKSVSSFLKELLIAVCAVVIVVMLLLPMRVALVAASTIPISIFIALALFYSVGIELNTVTLAALIVTLGMIVDNSIVIIDSYLEMIKEGMSRWHASIKSATHFFKSIFSATLAISITFFPFLFTMSGMTGDFVESFPWAVTIILMISLLVAELLVPFMQFYFIRKPMEDKVGKDGKKKFSFLDMLQGGYDWLIDRCFAHPKATIAMGFASVLLGLWLLSLLPQKLLPTAERNQFAVEIYMPTGTAVEKTTIVADSLEHILRADSRVVSVASFKGCSSPRFQNTYAPQMGGSNFAQFIVNTTGNDATEELLDEYAPRYRAAFPEAVIRFKQLCYSEATYPIELRLSGDDLNTLRAEADRIETMMRRMPEVNIVRSNFEEPLAATKISLNEDESTRLGITNAQLETTLAMRYSTGIPVGTIWEDDYDVNVVLKSKRADASTTDDLSNELIPVAAGLDNVPLRQIADVKPAWVNGQIVHRNGVRTITIMAEMERGVNAIATTAKIQQMIAENPVAEGVTLTYGGELEENEEQMPNIVTALIVAVVIIFLILVWHFKRISTATLLLVSLTLCLFGTALGVMIQGVDFSLTCTMGIISLMGILVRNGIIMIDYAEELRKEEKMCVRDAIYHSAKRRMRPIFLTSAAASMGVIPMILGGSGLWMPMGTVIFYGTLITMFFILTIIPVAYWKVMSGSTKKRVVRNAMENE
jgi:multidrug efflux pump subunit AcrB